MSLKTIEEDLRRIELQVDRLDKKMLAGKNIVPDILHTQKIFIKVELLFDQLKLEQNNEKVDNIQKRINDVRESIKHLKEYKKMVDSDNSNKMINLLTFINIVFLPLGVITGYFGMNFKSFDKNVFSIKRGHSFIWGLFIVVAIAVYLLIRMHVIQDN